MAVIQKIRSYSGLLIAVIGIGLAAFVLGDFLGHGPMRQQRFDVGKVEGNSITYQQFEQRVNQQMENWQAQTGMSSIGSQETFQFRQQVWNDMVREILMEEQVAALGLEVTAEELYNMIHGQDPHPALIQSFTDPATGMYDAQQVVQFLRNFDMLDPSVRNQWVMLERYMKEERLEDKYHQLIAGGYLVPAPMAARDFANRNITADIRFVYKSHNDIDDEQMQVGERDLRMVYDNHKHTFRRDASRSIRYVTLPVLPSESDRQGALNEIQQLMGELAATENIAAFINSVSDTRFDPSFYGQGELSPQIEPEIFNAETGTVVGPFMEDNAYVLAKLVDAQMRPDSMNASHILIAYQGSAASGPETMRNKEDAEQLSDSILTVVRRTPGRFGELAETFSDDPSVQMNQGALEWFPDGAMVGPFNEAVVEADRGSFVSVETDFGFHVIHVVDKSPASRKVRVARLTRFVEPGNQTYQEAYGRINGLANQLRDKKDFDAAAEEAGLTVREADNLGRMGLTLPGVDQGRMVIQWAFDESTKEGNFSRIFEINDTFVVATLSEKHDEGVPALEDIRDQIMAIALREAKQDMIAAQMREQLASTPSLDELAAAMELSTMVGRDLNFNSNNLTGAGNEPRVIATAFGLEQGSISAPIKGNNGVFVIEVRRRDDMVAPDDLSPNQLTLRNSFRSRVPFQAFQAIRAKADIEDHRSMFF